MQPPSLPPTRSPVPSHSLPASCSRFPALAPLAYLPLTTSTVPLAANLASLTVHAGGVLDSPLVMHHRLGLAIVSISPQPTIPSTTSCLSDVDNPLLAAHLTDRFASPTSVDPHTVRFHTDPDLRLFYGQDFLLDNDEYIGLASLPLLTHLSPQWCTTRIDPSAPDIPDLPDIDAESDSGEMCAQWLCQNDRMGLGTDFHPDLSSPSLSALPSPPRSPTIEELGMNFKDEISPSHRPRVIDAAEEPAPASEITPPLSTNRLGTDITTASRWQPVADALSTPPPSSRIQPLSALPPTQASLTTSSDVVSFPSPIIPHMLPLIDIPEPFEATSEVDSADLLDLTSSNTEYLVRTRHNGCDSSQTDSYLKEPLDLEPESSFEETHIAPISHHHAHHPSSSYEPPILTSLIPPSSLPLQPPPDDVTHTILPSTVPLAQSPSPSRRTFASLPELDIPDDFPSPIYNPTPPTHHHLRALPGADIDEDLIPPDGDPDRDSSHHHQPFRVHHPVPIHHNSLLLINDPNDVPPPRSPSPEYFTFDLDAASGAADPDLAGLCALRKRVAASERAARALEAQHLAQGNVHARTEVRRARKREKERSRELGALLRLKLGDRLPPARATADDDRDEPGTGPSSEAGSDQRAPASPKKGIGSLAQLVARMVFRRREAARALANRTAPTWVRPGYVSSPLARSVVASSDEEEEEELLSVVTRAMSAMSALPSPAVDHDEFVKDSNCKISATAHAPL